MKTPPCPLCHAAETRSFQTTGGRSFFDCPRCGLVFADPSLRLTPEAEKTHYDLHQNDPDAPAYRRFLEPVFQAIQARHQKGATGLDYGCGPGPALACMFEEAEFLCVRYDPFYFPDPARLQPEAFTFITCTETAEHFHEPGREFERLVQLLKPGGTLAVMTQPLLDPVRFQTWHYTADPTHVCFYPASAFEWLARRHRLQLETVTPAVTLLHKPTFPVAIETGFNPLLRRYESAARLETVLAGELRAIIQKATTAQNPVGLMLAGGRTPLNTYAHVRADPPHCPPSLRIFMSDERHVPTDAPENNFHQLDPLFRALRCQPENLLSVQTHLAPETAAMEFGRHLQKELDGGMTLPFGLLGMGVDGHIAGLFTPEQARLNHVLTCSGPRPDGLDGISTTPGLFQKIEQIVLTVTGESKREILTRLLTEPGLLPAGVVLSEHSSVEIWTDIAL